MSWSRRPSKEMDVKRQEDKAEVLRLRKLGHSYEGIAKMVGLYDKGTAHRYVREAMAELRETQQEDVKDILQLELARLDVATERAMGMIENGAPNQQLLAMDRLVKLMDRRAKYLGLDSPLKVDVAGAENPVGNLLVDAQGAMLVAQVEAYVAENIQEPGEQQG